MPFPFPVPVLMLHDVTADGAAGPDPYAISAGELARALDLVCAAGLHTATLDELLGGAARQPAAVVTFDDARAGVLERALPLLAARGQRGVVYAISDRSRGRAGFLDGEGLRSLARAGWTVGTHGATHRHLTGLSLAALRDEWIRSRSELEDLLAAPVRHGSLPGGRGRSREQREAAQAGLTTLATSFPGLWLDREQRLCIPRVTIRRGMSAGQLALALRGDLRWLLPARGKHQALELAKRLLGDPLYDALRERLLGVGAGEEG